MRIDGKFLSTNGRSKISYHKYIPDGEPIGIFQIVHGMSEFSLRYEKFAEFLCKAGYAVYTHDHAFHGDSVDSKEELGLFLNDKQDKVLINDVKKLSDMAKKDFVGKKFILFGHSMGSFIVRLYAKDFCEDLDGLIICGTGGANKLAPVGNIFINSMKLFRGGKHRSKTLDKMTFGSYNKHYDDVKTPSDWLSRDRELVRSYMNVEESGFTFSLDGMKCLMKLNVNSNHHEAFDLDNEDLKILITSGAEDPVGDFGKGVIEVYSRYLDAGNENVYLKIYEGARHEILNEINKSEVYEDLLRFADMVVK